ncbi:MAG: hypothetical protein ACJAT2_003823, partial [Bacteriovoracaceae bacterium]
MTIFLATTLTLSCSLKVEDEQADQSVNSPIILDSLSISSVQKNYDNALSISRPTHKSFLVKACFKESVFLEPIRGEEFIVSGTSYISDTNGCV